MSIPADPRAAAGSLLALILPAAGVEGQKLSLSPVLLQPFPLISASRWLLKRGELHLLLSEEAGLFRRGAGRLCHLFLFNDVLIITKKKR